LHGSFDTCSNVKEEGSETTPNNQPKKFTIRSYGKYLIMANVDLTILNDCWMMCLPQGYFVMWCLLIISDLGLSIGPDCKQALLKNIRIVDHHW